MIDLEFAVLPIVLDETEEEVQGTSRAPGRRRVRNLLRSARARLDDAGMATAEYAVAMVAATGFAGALLALLKSDVVRGLLTNIVRRALSV